jgi:hypothetical protein
MFIFILVNRLFFLSNHVFFLFCFKPTPKQIEKREESDRKKYECLLKAGLVEQDDDKYPPMVVIGESAVDDGEGSEDDESDTISEDDSAEPTGSPPTSNKRTRDGAKKDQDGNKVDVENENLKEDLGGKNEVEEEVPESALRIVASRIDTIDYKQITKVDLSSLWKESLATLNSEKVTLSLFLLIFSLLIVFL